MLLHGYWRSTASYRVRIALNLKHVEYRQATHDLRTGAQAAAPYAAINPQHLVPSLALDEGQVLMQSPAILEWLEETYRDPPLLPQTAGERAVVRAMVAIVSCDIHPLNNLRVLNALRNDYGADDAAVSAWIARWIADGFAALEQLIADHGRGFAFGDTPTLADCCLVPQLYGAERFKVDVSAYPRLVAAASAARALPEFKAARPEVQPDAD